MARRRSDLALDIRSVSHSYGDRQVLSGVTLQVERNAAVCLLGPSGCGKTTLLSIIAGLFKPNAGTVFIDGLDASNLSPQERDIGFVFQSESALFGHLNVFDNIAFSFRHGRRTFPGGNWQQAVNKIIHKTKLSAHREESILTLSGGLKQRVAIARAIVYRPSLLILDEPFNSLDNKLKREMLELLTTLREEIDVTLLFVTHDDREARQLASHIAVLNEGRIEQFDETTQVFANPASETVSDLLGLWSIRPAFADDKHSGIKGGECE